MHVVRVLGMILLAVYLFFNGLMMLADIRMPVMGGSLLGLIGMSAGVLLLVSLGKKGDR